MHLISETNIERLVGEDLGASGWFDLTQATIDEFAELTRDNQWVHVDPVRASKGPYGGTIAHGFLVLSLLPHLADQVYAFEGADRLINYGVNRVRFPNVVKSGGRVRNAVTLSDVKPHPLGRLITVRHALEVENEERPACVADVVTLVVFHPQQESQISESDRADDAASRLGGRIA